MFPPAVTEPSVVDTGIITSRPSGTRRVTQESCTLADCKRQKSKDATKKKKRDGVVVGGFIFPYLTSEYKQCEFSADPPVPLGLFFHPEHGRSCCPRNLYKRCQRRPAAFLRDALSPITFSLSQGLHPYGEPISSSLQCSTRRLFLDRRGSFHFQSRPPRSGSMANPSFRSKTGNKLEKSE